MLVKGLPNLRYRAWKECIQYKKVNIRIKIAAKRVHLMWYRISEILLKLGGVMHSAIK